MQLRWLDSLSVGIIQIDDQHRALIDAANELALRPVERTLSASLEEFITQIEHHFQTEEDVLRRLGYHDVGSHARMHREFLRTFRKYVNISRKPRPLVDREEFTLWLFCWLMDQVLAEDLQFKSFVLSVTGHERIRCRCIDMQPAPCRCQNYGLGRRSVAPE